MNEPTTIWTPHDVKVDLDKLKKSDSESYGNVIRRLIKHWNDTHKGVANEKR